MNFNKAQQQYDNYEQPEPNTCECGRYLDDDGLCDEFCTKEDERL